MCNCFTNFLKRIKRCVFYCKIDQDEENEDPKDSNYVELKNFKGRLVVDEDKDEDDGDCDFVHLDTVEKGLERRKSVIADYI